MTNSPNRLLNFPTTDDDYARELNAAMTRVRIAKAALKTEREALARLLRISPEPDGRTH